MTMNEREPIGLARRLGLFDITMIVMGGIIGSGIFINPYVVAQQVHSSTLILGAWVAGGLIALAGAFIYAELSSYTSLSGGQYIYLRDAIHPAVAFIYGWSLLLVIQSGGMAAVAVTFARYASEISGRHLDDHHASLLAALVLVSLMIINCFGVRAGSTTQNLFMLLKLLAIATLVGVGFAIAPTPPRQLPLTTSTGSLNMITAFGAALIPVQFAYGGWQTACFVAGEVRDPRRTLPRGLLLGVLGVVIVYVSVNLVCVRALGPEILAQTKTPASAVMGMALGPNGARIIAIGIAVSTLGFLSQSMLTAPRVYFAMAADGIFFRSVSRLNRARVPAIAIILQGVVAIIVVFSGRYEQILNYVVSVDVVFFALSAACLFVYRRHERALPPRKEASYNHHMSFRVPGHPFTTIFFIAACCALVVSAVWRYPHNSLIGLGLMLTGFPIYLGWRKRLSTVSPVRVALSDQEPDREEQCGLD
jgi:basic amino acid/polyamine antiporter, APA family